MMEQLHYQKWDEYPIYCQAKRVFKTLYLRSCSPAPLAAEDRQHGVGKSTREWSV